MRRKLLLCVLNIIPCLLLCSRSSGQAFKLEWPFKATLYKEIYPVNYVDEDTSSGKVTDYRCGSQTYDGHQGTDFVLRNFRQMDSGVVITAAAAGRVVYAVDTFFDRNKTYNKTLGYGNYIDIKHDSNYYTIYAHLRKHSARVKVGDSVKVGDTLGLIGASGYAVDPHLHFELWGGYTVIDPFGGGHCGPARSFWKTQPPYDTSYGIIDYGMVNLKATLDTLREKLPEPAWFALNDSFITFWIHEYGIKSGDTSQIYWYTPKSSYWFSYAYPHAANSRYYYWWSYIGPVSDTGLWTVYYEVNHKVKVTKQFRVKQFGTGTGEVAGNNVQLKISTRTQRWLLNCSTAMERVDIYSSSGVLIKPVTTNDQTQVEIETAQIPAGIYICRVQTKKNVVVRKIIVY